MKSIFINLIEIFIYSSILILAVFAIKYLAQKKISAKLVHLLWLIVLVRLVLPITLDSPIHVNIPRTSAITVPATEPLEENVVLDAPSASIPDSVSDSSISSAINNTTAKNNALPTALPTIDFYLIALMIWAAGAFIFLTVSSVRIVSFKQKLKQLNMTDNYKDQLESAKKELSIKREIRIAVSDHTDIPFVYGAIKPVIVIPKHFADNMSDAKLSCIIMHELCHVKRHDISMNLVWLLARAAHWFNPLTHIAYKSCLDSADKACDEMVSRNLLYEAKCEYSQSLIDVMRHARRNRTPALVLSFCRNKSTLGKRIENIIHPKKNSKIALVSMVLAVCVVVFACFTTACQPKDIVQKESMQIEPSTILEPTSVSAQNSSEVNLSETYKAKNTEMIKEEALQIINELNLADIVSINFVKREDYFGDSIAYFMCNENENSVSYSFLESNRSLISSENKAIDLSVPIELSDDESETLALAYAKKIWGNENNEITSCEASSLGPDDEHRYIDVKGVIIDNNRTFNMSLNGRGDLWGFSSYPSEFDISKGISVEEAKEIAINAIREQVHISDNSCLNLISQTLSAEYAPMYIFKCEYRSDNPTSEEYDYDCFVNVMAATGKTMGVGVTPIIYNIDVYSLDEAGDLALEYVAEKMGLESSKLTISQSWANTDNEEIIYTFMFDYDDDYSYSLMMTSIGEFWDIAGSPKQ